MTSALYQVHAFEDLAIGQRGVFGGLQAGGGQLVLAHEEGSGAHGNNAQYRNDVCAESERTERCNRRVGAYGNSQSFK